MDTSNADGKVEDTTAQCNSTGSAVMLTAVFYKSTVALKCGERQLLSLEVSTLEQVYEIEAYGFWSPLFMKTGTNLKFNFISCPPRFKMCTV